MSSTDVRLARLTMRELRIPLTVSFRHASAERAESSSVWVEAVSSDGEVGCGEGCPRRYVTGETGASAQAFLEAHHESIVNEVTALGALRAWMNDHTPEIDANPSAWCAIELAFLHLFGLRAGASIERLLGRASLPERFQYTAVLGDMPAAPFHTLAQRYFQQGFRDFKVKLSGDVARDRAKLAVFGDWPRDAVRIRADANNVWSSASQAIEALRSLECSWFAVEEPIGRDQYGDLARIAAALDTHIVLDESLRHRGQVAGLGEPAPQWIANVRVSKMGGLLRALDVIDAAAARGIGVIVGAQVGETSLLTRAGLTAASVAHTALVGHEGAFGTHLLTRDVCDPPLMFGTGGVLRVADYPWLVSAGLGRFALPATV